jgi:hypothetical protein
MKFAWLKTIIPLAAIALGIFSCNRSGDDVVLPSNNTPVAGKGGVANLRITPNHNGVDIDSAQIFIKYNSLIDTTGKFDDSAWLSLEDQKPPVVTFTNLKRGDYYIYAKGWNVFKSQSVSGSRFYTITTDTAATYSIVVEVD